MITITQNIEEKAYQHKDWYKEMDALVGESFDATAEFENSLQIGQKIHIDAENPVLPTGISIPAESTMTIDQLGSKTLVVNDISQKGDEKTIKLGIRSTEINDLV